MRLSSLHRAARLRVAGLNQGRSLPTGRLRPTDPGLGLIPMKGVARMVAARLAIALLPAAPATLDARIWILLGPVCWSILVLGDRPKRLSFCGIPGVFWGSRSPAALPNTTQSQRAAITEPFRLPAWLSRPMSIQSPALGQPRAATAVSAVLFLFYIPFAAIVLWIHSLYDDTREYIPYFNFLAHPSPNETTPTKTGT